jgi:hypothetical protein
MDLFEAWCRLKSAATAGREGRESGRAFSRLWLARLVKWGHIAFLGSRLNRRTLENMISAVFNS